MSHDDRNSDVVPIGPQSLLKRNSALVRRGLYDLAALAGRNRKRIVVAHHEEGINEVLEAILNKGGYEIRTTTHPSEVVALTDYFRPDAAIIALIAPEIDGVELSEQLSIRFPRLKIILEGFDVEERVLQYLRDRGINCDRLKLPVEANDLVDMMKSWIKER